MIQMPRRSVTRFFIPLIDVMILLFCIFLLMPVFKEADPENPDNLEKQAHLREIRKLRAELEQLRSEVDQLRKRQAAPLQQRVSIRVLEIDPANGRLFNYEPGQPPKRREIDGPGEARALVERQREELKKRHPNAKTRPELYYLILLPRVDSAFPRQGQLDAYDRWFKGVSHSFEKPGANP